MYSKYLIFYRIKNNCINSFFSSIIETVYFFTKYFNHFFTTLFLTNFLFLIPLNAPLVQSTKNLRSSTIIK